MAKAEYQGFQTDETMVEFLQKLEQAEAKAQELSQTTQKNQAQLNAAQAATTAAAAALAQKETQLAEACQNLENTKQKLAKEKAWQQELEKDKSQKAYTLAAAQKAVEDALKRLESQELETARTNAAVQEKHKEIDLYTGNIKAAYNEWQAKNQQLQNQKAKTIQLQNQANQLRVDLENFQNQKTKSQDDAANAIAQIALNSYLQNLEIKDIPVVDLPKLSIQPQNLEQIDTLASNQTTSENLAATEFAQESEPKPLPISLNLADLIAESLGEQPKTTPPPMTELEEIIREMQQPQRDLPTISETFPPPAENKKSVPLPPREADFWDNPNKPEKRGSKNSEPPTPSSLQDYEPPKQKNLLLSYIMCVVIALALALVIRQYAFQITKISGDSMNPTLISGDRLFTSSISYYFEKPQRGDIIVFPAPDRVDKAPYIKRVIAIPGDHLIITKGIVTINDQPLAEPYLNNPKTLGEVDTIIPEGKVFVMGDNRMVSHDSRSDNVSLINTQDIISKAVWRLYPFDKVGNIK